MINLHDVVRPVITALHPDEYVKLYQYQGTVNVKGTLTPNVVSAEGLTVLAQIQTLGSDELQQREYANRTEIDRKAYLYAPDSEYSTRGIDRWFVRDGDFLQRGDGTWWLVTSVMEDFTRSGWVCVGITKQITPPNIGA